MLAFATRELALLTSLPMLAEGLAMSTVPLAREFPEASFGLTVLEVEKLCLGIVVCGCQAIGEIDRLAIIAMT